MISQPTIEERQDQPYVGIKTRVPMQQLPEVIPQLLDEVMAWLGTQGVGPSGPPLIRYHVIDMAGQLDIELGWPVAAPLRAEGRVEAGVLPAGRYGTLIYKDANKGIEGNRALIEWAEAQGLAWDSWETERGDAFRSRFELFLDGPAEDPDPANWDTLVAIRLADSQEVAS